jgi:hypothetical protein
MLKRVLIDEAVEVVCERTRHFGRSPGARAVLQALGALRGKALHPFTQGGIGKAEGRGDGVDMAASDDLTDGLRTAKAPGLLGLLEDSLSSRQCISAELTFQGAHRLAPWRIMASHILHTVMRFFSEQSGYALNFPGFACRRTTLVRFSHDYNISSQNITDGAGRLRYSFPGVRSARGFAGLGACYKRAVCQPLMLQHKLSEEPLDRARS